MFLLLYLVCTLLATYSFLELMDTNERFAFYTRCINPATRKRFTFNLLFRAMFCHVVDDDDNLSNGAKLPTNNTTPPHPAPPTIQQQAIIPSSPLTPLTSSSQATSSSTRIIVPLRSPSEIEAYSALKANLERKRKRAEDTKGMRREVRRGTQPGDIASFPRVTPSVQPLSSSSYTSGPMLTTSRSSQQRVVLPSPSPVTSIMDHVGRCVGYYDGMGLTEDEKLFFRNASGFPQPTTAQEVADRRAACQRLIVELEGTNNCQFTCISKPKETETTSVMNNPKRVEYKRKVRIINFPIEVDSCELLERLLCFTVSQ
jgi:hypothetical protein